MSTEDINKIIYNICHDIKTPFSGIIGLAKIMHDKEANLIKKNYLYEILRTSEMLMMYIEKTLISSAEGLYNKVYEDTFSVEELIQFAENIFRAKSITKKIPISFYYESTITYIKSDFFKLKTILINLIGNALKFTNSGKISVIFENSYKKQDKNQFKLTVKDTGIGISPSQLSIIQKNLQTEKNPSNLYSGYGLYVIQKLLNLLGGKLVIKSKLGEGSTFICFIPCKDLPSTNYK